MDKYKMPFNQYKACQKMSQKDFSKWVEALTKESWQQGYAKALEHVPDEAIVIDASNTMVINMNEEKLEKVLLSVPGVGSRLCGRIIDAIYEAFDGYVSEGGINEHGTNC